MAADQDLKLPAESSSIDALESIGAKPAPKSRSRKDKKGQTGGKPPVKSESDIEIRAVDVSLTQQSSHSAEQETAVAAIEPPATSPVEELVSNPIALEHVSLTVPKEQAENKIENYPNSTTKFVDLGKWATSLEPANDSGFQFGSFGGEVSSASAVSRSPARISTAERNQKPFSKNASWKSEHNKKNASVSQQSNNDSRHGSVESSWAAGSIETGSFDNAGAVFSGVKSEGRRSADTASANRVPGTENGTAAVAPPGLVASQNLDSNRSSSSAHNSSNSGQKGNNSRKYQDSEQSGKQSSQSNAPPGINIRAQNSGNGFSNVMPVGVVPNMPYVNVPYDGSHQAPSLHPVSSYGVMQANFTSAAGALPAVPPSNASAVGTASSASLVQQAVPGAGGSANASANPHQPSYQSAPPGMTYMTSYPYNPPYYGHQFYYTGQPQAYYGRGQPMYQQPPRSMYGGDGYGSGGHGIGGYPDMYGSPGAQFGDSQYSGSSVHHHGQVGHGSASGPERGGKQKNAVSSNGSSQQSGMPSVESHHISYPGYGSSYSGRDVQPQYQYQGGWNPNPVIYPPSTVQGNVGPAGVFQGAGGRAHENASKSSSGYSGSQYVGGARGGSGSATVGNNPSQSGSAAPGSSLQSGGW